jgi:uncharacterized protein (DUF302 family)
MAYYLQKHVDLKFDQAIETVTEELKKEGFGILSVIDVKAKLKEKIDVDFRNYTILGACNPPFAFKALETEPYIGTMLPCSVIVQEWKDGRVDVAAIDPLASMKAVDNRELQTIAKAIKEKLEKVIEQL